MTIQDFNPLRGLIWMISTIIQSYQSIKWNNNQTWLSSDWCKEMRRK